MNRAYKNCKVNVDVDYLLCSIIEDNGEFARFKREQNLVLKGKGNAVELRRLDDSSTRSNMEVMTMVRLLRLNNVQQWNLYLIARLYGKQLVRVPEFQLSQRDKEKILDYIFNANQKQKYWSSDILADYWKRKVGQYE